MCLDGNDDASINETAPPTLPGNIPFYPSLVEDFYDDGGIVFEDMKSPQYQALGAEIGSRRKKERAIKRILVTVEYLPIHGRRSS